MVRVRLSRNEHVALLFFQMGLFIVTSSVHFEVVCHFSFPFVILFLFQLVFFYLTVLMTHLPLGFCNVKHFATVLKNATEREFAGFSKEFHPIKKLRKKISSFKSAILTLV